MMQNPYDTPIEDTGAGIDLRAAFAWLVSAMATLVGGLAVVDQWELLGVGAWNVSAVSALAGLNALEKEIFKDE